MNLTQALPRRIVVSAVVCLLSACGMIAAEQSSHPTTSAAATGVADKVEYPPATLPEELIGVWSGDDADGRAQCARYRALPADVGESDEGLTSLIGSVVITASMIHQYSEYGEGNFYAVRGVEALGTGIWKVVVQLGTDTMPTAEDHAERETHRLEVRQDRLNWKPQISGEDRTYFRCGDIRRDAYQVERNRSESGAPRVFPAAANASLVDALGIRCDDSASGGGCILGNLDAGDYYDVNLSPACNANGQFAGVVDADPALLDTLPVTGSNVRTNARLRQGQFVCVQVIARAGQQPAYYYVAAISPDRTGACEGREICERYGMRPVDFEAQVRSGIACMTDANGHVQGDCARGWINAKSLEFFADGL